MRPGELIPPSLEYRPPAASEQDHQLLERPHNQEPSTRHASRNPRSGRCGTGFCAEHAAIAARTS